MRVTRYLQSCLLVEEGDTRIAMDTPMGFDIGELGKVDGVLFTHEHSDHFDASNCKKFSDQGVQIYANASTAKQIEGQVNIIEDGQEFKIGELKFKAIELPHCLMPDGNEGPQNTGYLINEKLFDPGDGKSLDNLQVENLALPITGPDISMKDAFDFAKQVGAKKAIPMHYDMIGANAEVYAAFAKRVNMPFDLIVLKQGESTEL